MVTSLTVVPARTVAPAMMMSETRSDLAAGIAKVVGTLAVQVTRDLKRYPGDDR